ncbi:MAG: hypothetical protein K2G70_03200 [Turicibacter sp.]|nr:hypothetical protein [Turicibacter sp.]
MRIIKCDGGKSIHFKYVGFGYRLNKNSSFYVRTIRCDGIFIVGCSVYKLELAIGFTK